jgi:peptidyl-tRNA hydrolase, PTH1 family
MQWLIIGLGNPEEKYTHTRHNVGFLIMDGYEVIWKHNPYAFSMVADYADKEIQAVLVKPQTYMNHSGKILPYFFEKHGCTPERTIVIYDDLDIPFGKIRLSYDRGDGGHNGIKSLIEHAKTRSFIRIRVGISLDRGEGKVFKQPVLGVFTPDELHVIHEMLVPRIHEVIHVIMREGIQIAMNRYNHDS